MNQVGKERWIDVNIDPVKGGDTMKHVRVVRAPLPSGGGKHLGRPQKH